MLVVFTRAVILYVLLIFSVRLMGKHQIGELQPSELAVTILISNIATLPVEDVDMPLFTGVIPILTLSCLDVIMSWFGVKSRRIRGITCGKPVVIIKDGVIDQKKMRDIRFTSDDLMEALHSKDIFDINEVEYAVVETTGAVSVYQKFSCRNITNGDMNKHGRSFSPPEIIIDGGKIVREALSRAGTDEKNILAVLKKEKLALCDVFLMTMDGDGKYTLIRKDKAK